MGKRGPKPIDINWDVVENLMSYQCNQEEVAHFFGKSVDWLEICCMRDHGIKLSEYWNKKRALGRVKLRKLQFQLIEKGGAGAATMAIYLDKKMFPLERVDLPPAPPNPQPDSSPAKVRTFVEFCEKADYFVPYEKQEEMRAFAIDRSDTRLLLGARGYGKTDYCTIMGVAYDLYLAYATGLDMSLFTNLIITKTKTRAGAIVEEIKNATEKNGVPLDKATGNILRVQGLVGQDHSVEAITIKTSFRGRHPKRITMDDPVTDEDVSEAMRTLVKRRYDEAYKLCSNIVIIGQPAHFDDLYANLRNVISTLLVPHGSIPQLDADLEAMKLAGVDQNSIEMSYHLRVPKDGSSIFSNLKYLDKWPVGDSVAMIDPSDGGDLTALTVAHAYFNGIVVQGYAWKKAWYHCTEDMLKIFKELQVRKICFETNHTGTQPLIQLRELLGPLQIGVVGKHSTTDKHSAIQSAGSYAHQIHLSRESMPVYIKAVEKYEYRSTPDDPPDSLARLLEWLGLIRSK